MEKWFIYRTWREFLELWPEHDTEALPGSAWIFDWLERNQISPDSRFIFSFSKLQSALDEECRRREAHLGELDLDEYVVVDEPVSL